MAEAANVERSRSALGAWLSPAMVLAWPGYLLVTAVVFVPMIPAFLAAFREGDGFTPAHIAAFFTEAPNLEVMVTTLIVAGTVAFGAVLLTMPACLIAADRGGAVLKIFVGCVLVSFWVSVLVRTFAWNVLLARLGPVALAIEAVFGPGAVPQMLYTRSAVVACMIQIMIPYATLMILPAARQVDRDLVLAAKVLGATPWQAFRKAYWPQIKYSVLSAWLLTFIVSMGFFVTPALLGGPDDRLIVMLIESQLHSFDIEMASANAFMLMLIMLVTTGIVLRLTRLPFNRLVGEVGR
jgi:putative spermidine/putrescine transport system permease protein